MPPTMRGLWLENQQLSYREDLPVPKVVAGSALIRVLVAGICATDIEMLKGYYPYVGVPGHEFVGVVVAAPDDPSWVGQRVVGEINIVCGDCDACRRGDRPHCFQRQTLGLQDADGAFAEYLLLPVRNLHRVPASILSEDAVFIEPLAAAAQILNQVSIQPQDRVLVIGAGRLGLLVAQVMATTRSVLRVVTRRSSQDEILAAWGIESVRKDQLRFGDWDVVIEATGSVAGFQLAQEVVRPRGTIVLKSTYVEPMVINFSRVVVNEINLIGSRCGPFPPAIDLLSRKKVKPGLLLRGQFSLADGVKAFEQALKPGSLKIIMRP